MLVHIQSQEFSALFSYFAVVQKMKITWKSWLLAKMNGVAHVQSLVAVTWCIYRLNFFVVTQNMNITWEFLALLAKMIGVGHRSIFGGGDEGRAQLHWGIFGCFNWLLGWHVVSMDHWHNRNNFINHTLFSWSAQTPVLSDKQSQYTSDYVNNSLHPSTNFVLTRIKYTK